MIRLSYCVIVESRLCPGSVNQLKTNCHVLPRIGLTNRVMVGKLAVEWTWNASGICYHPTCLCNGLQSISLHKSLYSQGITKSSQCSDSHYSAPVECECLRDFALKANYSFRIWPNPRNRSWYMCSCNPCMWVLTYFVESFLVMILCSMLRTSVYPLKGVYSPLCHQHPQFCMFFEGMSVFHWNWPRSNFFIIWCSVN